jgi:PAS domain-containing protein
LPKEEERATYSIHPLMRKAPPVLAGVFVGFLLPLLYCSIVLLFDWRAPFRTVTPPLLTMGLLGMAFFLRPSWMALWAAVYSFVTGSILMNIHLWGAFNNGYLPPETVSHRYRLAGFLTTAAFSVVFCSVLHRLRAKRESLNHLIEHMPLPVIMSDCDGKILMMNAKARTFLRIPETTMIANLRYFDLLAPVGKHGKCIAEYLKCFEGVQNHIPGIPLELHGQAVTGHFEILKTRPKRLLTMITQEKESA